MLCKQEVKKWANGSPAAAACSQPLERRGARIQIAAGSSHAPPVGQGGAGSKRRHLCPITLSIFSNQVSSNPSKILE
jgi:hypothetical protein